MQNTSRMIAAGIIVVLGGGLLAYTSLAENGNSADIDGTYELFVTDEGETAVIRMLFDRGTMTYMQQVEAGGETVTVDSGTFAAEEAGAVQTFSETDDANSLRYVSEGDYIIAENRLYEGVIPDGQTFDAQCFYPGDEVFSSSSITFFEDGTYTEESKDAEGREGAGTYKRDQDLIHCTGNDGNTAFDLYVFGEQAAGSFYKKAEKD